MTFDAAAFAALMSAIATALAAYATWIGPRSAAKLAEKLRRESEATVEARRNKMWVFTTLMQERASIASPDSVRALNLIDVVFKDSSPVREAWAELFNAFDNARDVPLHVREERTRTLLRAMAADMQLSDGLRSDDFGRIYYPNVLAEEERVRTLERQAALQRLLPQVSPETNVAAAPGPAAPQTFPADAFPPKPSAVSKPPEKQP